MTAGKANYFLQTFLISLLSSPRNRGFSVLYLLQSRHLDCQCYRRGHVCNLVQLRTPRNNNIQNRQYLTGLIIDSNGGAFQINVKAEEFSLIQNNPAKSIKKILLRKYNIFTRKNGVPFVAVKKIFFFLNIISLTFPALTASSADANSAAKKGHLISNKAFSDLTTPSKKKNLC